LALGTAGYLLFEWSVTLGAMPALDRVVNALFMSATARTAGFNSVDYSAVS
ncbi:MAG: potassium transporter TrkH, partial [Gammaproteobacteria bacterium]|nr:potassium transporter TrkH [Gemmatimonadota bacterium]NIU78812.1 potassium transporter TrkH [Gammaproteobacteria bacterium]